MSIRIDLLAFINSLQNEVMMFDLDPDCSMFDDKEIIEKFRATISVLERLYPMIQSVDEVYSGDITPDLFWEKWKKVKIHFDFPDDDVSDISNEVTDFLKNFGPEGEAA